VHPGGHARNHVFNQHGHVWQEEPYTHGSRLLGDNPLSEWKGTQIGHGPTNHFDVLLQNGAGGKFKVQGDYLFRDQASFYFDGGIWGLLRVGATTQTTTTTGGTTTGGTGGTAVMSTDGCTVDAKTGETVCPTSTVTP